MNKDKKYKVVFCDLDGTLIETVSGKTFPEGNWDMKFKMDVLSAIKNLNPEYLFIVTNQGGIEKGFVNEEFFESKLQYICSSIEEYCECKCYGMYCTSNDESYPYRKPNPMMLEHLTETYIADDFDYIKSVSLMIGDASGLSGQFSDSDKKPAENFGIDYLDVDDFVKIYS